MLKVIHNVTTNEILEREMNTKELAQFELDKETQELKTAQELEKTLAKIALLAKLGITEEEAKLLLS